MDKRKLCDYVIIGFLLLIFTGGVSGCGESKKEPQADKGSMNSESGEGRMETESSAFFETETDAEKKTEEEFSDEIFYWGAEEYFNSLEGEWVAMEYAGSISDYHFDEAREEWYQEKEQEYTNEIIEKYLGSEYRIEINNLVYFAPYTDLDLIMEDNEELFSVTRFIPGEFVTITPPYIGLSAQLVDNNERYRFIIDADGTVLIEIEYCFFRLERH